MSTLYMFTRTRHGHTLYRHPCSWAALFVLVWREGVGGGEAAAVGEERVETEVRAGTMGVGGVEAGAPGHQGVGRRQ